MIIQGINGSINLFYKELLISSFPLSNKKTFKYYQKETNKCMIEGFNNNISLKIMIKAFKELIELTYLNKKNNIRMNSSDHQLFCIAVFGLIKLKEIEQDDYILICPKKKFKSLIRNN